MKVWIVTWSHADNSGFGVVTGFGDEEAAEKFVEAVRPISARELQVFEVDLSAGKAAEESALEEALKQAYQENQNMQCYQTKGNLNKALNAQTVILRNALKIHRVRT